ncbi:MAG: 16S rRNA (uracil(1498)-N(3))-methyltransferase [Flavobacteriales bacterium]
MQLFFNPNIESDLFLEKEEHIHATKVLRKKEGDILSVMDGKGGLFECKLIQISSKKSLVEILGSKKFDKTNRLHIGIAPTKNNNRMEWFLEKATEIGISEITPLLCSRSERKVLKNERMHKIILAAAKQSKSFHVPVLNEMISFSSFVKKVESKQKFVAHCEEDSEKKTLHNHNLLNTESTVILIGPEGDFTAKEIEEAKSHNFEELSLGESRLRTETAAMVACAYYNLIQ